MTGFALGRKIVVKNYKAEEVSERFNGRTGKIVENKFGSIFIRVRLDDDNMECLFTESEIELVTETPQPSFVKIIPEQVIPARREIVAGSFKTRSRGVAVYFTPQGEFVQIDTSKQYFNSEDIRQLITHLTTLASVLEENAK